MAATPIRLTVPGALRYREIAVRVVAEAARLVSGSAQRNPDDPLAHDVRHPFDTAVVSAFMEIFNNVAIHAYQRSGAGTIELAITPGDAELAIEVRDHGRTFDLDGVAPLPTELDADTLPEGGMGIHIAKTMLDEMTYEPGPPNLWRLLKRLQPVVGRTATSMGTGVTTSGAGTEKQEDLMPTLPFDIQRTATETKVTIRGSLDINTASSLGEEIDRMVALRPAKVVVDLSGLDLIDSSGVAALVKLYKGVRGVSGVVAITGARDQPLAIFKLLRMDKVFNL